MTTTVHEIAPEIFRIATSVEGRPITFIQFLIRDEKPLLYHTGARALFPDTIEAIKRIVDPAALRYISWSHLESDECGAVNDLLGVAPRAELVHGEIGVRLSIADFFDRPVTAMADDGVLELGEKRLRFLVTPNVPHCWDAIMAYEETTGTLFCSDLFASYGNLDPITESDIVGPSVAQLSRGAGSLPIGPHTGVVLDRLADLSPRMIAGHHSSAYTGDTSQALRDLKSELLAFAGIDGNR
jgi:flavorubredoxin